MIKTGEKKMNYDTTTINFKGLNRFPIFKKPPTYSLQDHLGNGCYGDPPGYPTYFTQSVYTQHGNSPRKGPQTVLFGRVIQGEDYWEKSDEDRKDLFNSLWLPLPIDHPRTRAWILATYRHHHHCYYDPSQPGDFGRGHKLIIWPVPHYELKSFSDDPRFSDEWRTKEKASIEQANREIIEAAKLIAIPENHAAVVIIRRFYPDYQPEIDLIENNPVEHIANWWERYAENFKPEDCPGESGKKHPANGTWCQMCGWSEKS
jgi:hypothetical protein